jgi:protein-tyrosine phosphatase
MAWLLLTGRAAGVDEAESLLRAARPAIVISPALRQALQALLDAPALAAPQMAPVTAPQQATA